jgi:hypothetical protein
MMTLGSGRDWTRQEPEIFDLEAPRAPPGGYCGSWVIKGVGGPDRDYRDPLVRRLGLLRFGARPPAETRATPAGGNVRHASTDPIQCTPELAKAAVA